MKLPAPHDELRAAIEIGPVAGLRLAIEKRDFSMTKEARDGRGSEIPQAGKQ